MAVSMYGKHFQSMYTGSMVGAGPVVFAVWGYVISHCDKEGLVELNPVLIGAMLGGTVEEVRSAIAALMQPDPDSRNQDFNGARLVQRAPHLYFAPSYTHYRAIRDDESKREYMREYMRKRRAVTQAPDPKEVGGRKPELAQVGHAPAPAPARKKHGRVASADPGFDLFWALYPRKVKKPSALKAWRAQNASEHYAAIEADLATRRWSEPRFIPHPSTYLNNRQWEDEPERAAQTARSPAPLPPLSPQAEIDLYRKHMADLGQEPKI